MRLGVLISAHRLLIAITAISAVFLLSLTPFGTLYQTLLGYSEEERVAEVLVAGLEKPKVEIVVGEAPSGEYVILTVSEEIKEIKEIGEITELTLTVPASWHLSEVRGVHARKVVSYPLENKKTMLMPLAGEIELRFTVGTPFETLSFSHTGSSPALVSLTHISLPSKEIQNEVQLVDGGITFALPSSL